MTHYSAAEHNRTGELNTVFNVLSAALVLALFIADIYFTFAL